MTDSKVVLYIAASLDGFIAAEDGSLDWLTVHDGQGADFGYGAFYGSIGSMLMGRKTYEFVARSGDWPHADRPAYVLSTTRDTLEHVAVRRGEIDAVLDELVAAHGRVWLVGRGGLVVQALRAGRLDEIILTVVPIILGRGLRLFDGDAGRIELRHLETSTWPGGLVQTRYAVGRS